MRFQVLINTLCIAVINGPFPPLPGGGIDVTELFDTIKIDTRQGHVKPLVGRHRTTKNVLQPALLCVKEEQKSTSM